MCRPYFKPPMLSMLQRAPGGQSSGSSNGGFTGTSGLSIQSGGAPPSTQSGFPFSQPQSVGLSGSGGQASVAARELIVNVQPLVFILTLFSLWRIDSLLSRPALPYVLSFPCSVFPALCVLLSPSCSLLFARQCTVMFLLMLLSFPQASEFLLWVFIGAFVAAMLRGLSLYRHLANQARAQRAFARLLGLPPSSTSFLLSNPSALASPFPPFGPPFSSLPFQPARGAAVPLSDLPSFPSLSPFPAFPSSLSPSITPSSSSGNLSQSTSAAARSASALAGAESARDGAAASASAAQRMHVQQPQAQALSELGGEWFGVGERGGRMEDGSLLAARIGSLLALMHRELQASDYDLLRALDADNTPSVPALSDVEIARLPAFPYKPKRYVVCSLPDQ
ncbi:unnamed protein product [Closterium sp. NIES-65]|nr:unnamed protein product [Closterium sp. NIES-65]